MFDPTTAVPVEEPQGPTLPLDFVKKLEGWNPKAYGDYKQTSIGFGTRAKHPGELIDEQEGLRRLNEELSSHALRVDAAAKQYGIALTPGQRDALVSFDFNTGQAPTVMESRDPQAISDRMALYHKVTVKGRKVANQGLMNRRKAEIDRFWSNGQQPVAQGDIDERPVFDPTTAKPMAGSFDPSSAKEVPLNEEGVPIAQPTERGLRHVGEWVQQNVGDAVLPIVAAQSLDWSDVRNRFDQERIAAADAKRAQALLAIENGSGSGPGSEAFQLRREADAIMDQLSEQGSAAIGNAELRAIAEEAASRDHPVAEFISPITRGITDSIGGATGGALGAAAFRTGKPIIQLLGGLLGAGFGSSAQESGLQAAETPEETIARQEESARIAQQDPVRYAIGQNLAVTPFFKPSITEIGRAIQGEANAAQNVRAALGIGAGVTGAGQVLSGQSLDPAAMLRGGLENVIMSKPTRLGRAIGFDPSSAVEEGAPESKALEPTPAKTAAPDTPTVPKGGVADALSEPPVPDGFVRFYHGGVPDPLKQGKWVTQDRAYAQGYASKSSGGIVQYVDIPLNHPKLRKVYDDTGTPIKAPYVSFEADDSLMAGAKALGRETQAKPTKLADVEAQILSTEKPEEAQMGSLFGNIKPRFKTKDIVVPEADLRSNDPAVEKRWQSAKIQKEGLWSRLKQKGEEMKNAVTRPAYAQDLDPNKDGRYIEWAAQFSQVPAVSRQRAYNVLQGLTNKLAPKSFSVFQRDIILRDILKDIDRGMHAGKDLPFGYKDRDAVEADLQKFDAIAQATPEIAEALSNRKQLITALRDEMVTRDLLPPETQDFDDYFRRQVLTYYNARKEISGIGSKATDKTYGFQKGRKGSSEDFNTEYLEAEGEYLSQAYAKLRAHDMLAQVKKWGDIKPRLMAEAKASGDDWKDLIPEDFTTWQPKPGKVFYWTKTLPERVVDEIFRLGGDTVTKDQVGEALALGGDRETWVIPKRLAKTLDSFEPPVDSLPGKIAGAINSGWKKLQLFLPQRVLSYNLNNLSGDVDIAVAYDPKILSYVPAALKELKGTASGKKGYSPEVIEAMEKGVISTGMTATEYKNIASDDAFAMLTGKKPGRIQQYFKTAEAYSQWRESVTRLAAYRYFKDKINSGAKNVLAASRKEILDDIPDPKDKAARLARELMGDYGSTSPVGKWLAEKVIPFWRFQGINLERYANLIRNAAKEGGNPGGYGRKAAVGAYRGGKLAVKANLVGYGLTWLWNHLMFPEEEKELSDAERRQLHLILGRNDDGTIQTLRIQGSLSDLLSWVGLQDYPEDIRKMLEDKKTVGDMVKEAGEAAISKVANSAIPLPKAALEAAVGKSTFPSVIDPSPIRDSKRHLASTVGARWIYDQLNDIPMPKSKKDSLMSLISYTSDPGEAAYMTSRELVYNWIEKQGKERGAGEPTARSNALYYHKQAKRYGDAAQAERWLEKYYALGGTPKGVKQSVERSEPLGPISKNDRQTFLDSLSTKDRQILDRAEAWYQSVYSQ